MILGPIPGPGTPALCGFFDDGQECDYPFSFDKILGDFHFICGPLGSSRICSKLWAWHANLV